MKHGIIIGIQTQKQRDIHAKNFTHPYSLNFKYQSHMKRYGCQEKYIGSTEPFSCHQALF